MPSRLIVTLLIEGAFLVTIIVPKKKHILLECHKEEEEEEEEMIITRIREERGRLINQSAGLDYLRRVFSSDVARLSWPAAQKASAGPPGRIT